MTKFRKVGEVNREKVDWFLLSDGRLVSLHVAFEEHPARNPNAIRHMIYSDNETFPGVTARNLGIDYAYMRNATANEAESFWRDREETVKEVIHV